METKLRVFLVVLAIMPLLVAHGQDSSVGFGGTGYYLLESKTVDGDLEEQEYGLLGLTLTGAWKAARSRWGVAYRFAYMIPISVREKTSDGWTSRDMRDFSVSFGTTALLGPAYFIPLPNGRIALSMGPHVSWLITSRDIYVPALGLGWQYSESSVWLGLGADMRAQARLTDSAWLEAGLDVHMGFYNVTSAWTSDGDESSGSGLNTAYFVSPYLGVALRMRNRQHAKTE